MLPNTEYYKSERFIWDRLKGDAERGLNGLYATWKVAGQIEPFLISWPAEAFLDDNGVPTDAPCLLNLPANEALWARAILSFAQKTKAYGLLLTEQLKERNEVRVTLESHHGTRSWSIPIQVSGDIRTLGTAVVQDDTHRIGVLWNRPAFG